MAQAPKWVEKAKRAVFSVVTYDKEDKLLNTGNGFFVTEDGVALSDCSLFKGAQRAEVIDADGKRMAVYSILGLNDMYDVIKFKVAISDKRVPALQIAPAAPVVDATVYLLPYSTQKDRNCTSGKVKAISKVAEKHDYYTLAMQLKEKMVSTPAMNEAGEVFGLAQRSSGRDTSTTCYAVGASFAFAQSINAFSLSDATLRNIGIRKGLPDTEEQALVFLFMASSQLTPAEYAALLNDYVLQYPNSTDGYIRRANHRLFTAQSDADFAQAAADMDQALKVAKRRDEIYYHLAKMIYTYQLSKPQPVFRDWTYDKALEQVRSAIAIDPLPVYTQLEGDILFAKQEYAAALVCYEKITAGSMASSETFFNVAKTKEVMGADPKEILVSLDSCIARAPQPISAELAPYLLERAQMRVNAEQYRAALLDYDAYYEAVDGKLVNDLFYYYREQAALKAKQFKRALDDIAKAIELNPTELTYRCEQAVINLRVGRNEEAVIQLNEVIKLDPKYAEAYRLLGICQIQLKKKSEACANFTKAKELGDSHVEELILKHCN